MTWMTCLLVPVEILELPGTSGLSWFSVFLFSFMRTLRFIYPLHIHQMSAQHLSLLTSSWPSPPPWKAPPATVPPALPVSDLGVPGSGQRLKPVTYPRQRERSWPAGSWRSGLLWVRSSLGCSGTAPGWPDWAHRRWKRRNRGLERNRSLRKTNVHRKKDICEKGKARPWKWTWLEILSKKKDTVLARDNFLPLRTRMASGRGTESKGGCCLQGKACSRVLPGGRSFPVCWTRSGDLMWGLSE